MSSTGVPSSSSGARNTPAQSLLHALMGEIDAAHRGTCRWRQESRCTRGCSRCKRSCSSTRHIDQTHMNGPHVDVLLTMENSTGRMAMKNETNISHMYTMLPGCASMGRGDMPDTRHVRGVCGAEDGARTG